MKNSRTKKLKIEKKSNQVLSAKKKSSLFDFSKIPPLSKEILKNFDEILDLVLPLSQKQKRELPFSVKNLSQSLTYKKNLWSANYLQTKSQISSYARYFMWWNLVRLVPIFSNFEKNALNLNDGDVILDLGSGPLTAICALWLSAPDLRKKHLEFYCTDISRNALLFGEKIFSAITQKTQNQNAWKIFRVTSNFYDVKIKKKASLVICANSLGENFPSRPVEFEKAAKNCAIFLCSFVKKNARILAIEPGTPNSARFLSLLRNFLIQKNFFPISPCPHFEFCPMCGSANKKWCNFAFWTKNAPQKLKDFSQKAQLEKKRAILSFLLLKNCENSKNFENQPIKTQKKIVRIASEPLFLKDFSQDFCGFYACSDFGLLLIVCPRKKNLKNGDLLEIDFTDSSTFLPDKKSGAKIIEIA